MCASVSVFCGRLRVLILCLCGKVDWQDWSWPWEIEGQIPDGWYSFWVFIFTTSSGMIFRFNSIKSLLRDVEGVGSSSMFSWTLKCHP